MKNESDDLSPSESKYNHVLQDVINRMGKELVAWRRTPESSAEERQKLLDSFIIASFAGFQLMATRLLRWRKRTDELDQLITSGQLDESDAADDFAQSCAMKLVEHSCDENPRAPFIPATIDELLTKAAKDGLPETGIDAPISGYLHTFLFNSVNSRIRDVTKKAKKLRVGSENSVPQFDLENLTVSDRRWGSDIAGYKAKVSLHQNVEIARKVQDVYLDSETYKGKPLRFYLGAWTPLDEWIGFCGVEDRPKSIEEETLRKHINNVRFMINLEKEKVKKPKDD